MIHTLTSLEETQVLAAKFVKFLSAAGADGCHPHNVFGFSGDLGSGKTAFTKSIAKELGVTEHVTSPTFVIQKRYPIDRPGFPFKTLIHIDAYRLESAHELEVLRFQEEARDPANLILIEWPEKVADILPEDLLTLTFSFVDEQARTIQFPDIMEG